MGIRQPAAITLAISLACHAGQPSEVANTQPIDINTATKA